jgi:hypothetical protein
LRAHRLAPGRPWWASGGTTCPSFRFASGTMRLGAGLLDPGEGRRSATRIGYARFVGGGLDWVVGGLDLGGRGSANPDDRPIHIDATPPIAATPYSSASGSPTSINSLRCSSCATACLRSGAVSLNTAGGFGDAAARAHSPRPWRRPPLTPASVHHVEDSVDGRLSATQLCCSID